MERADLLWRALRNGWRVGTCRCNGIHRRVVGTGIRCPADPVWGWRHLGRGRAVRSRGQCPDYDCADSRYQRAWAKRAWT